MYYYGARWYDPSIGRFIGQDPTPSSLSDPQALNVYVYARDAPTTMTDPSGLAVAYGIRPCWDWFGLLPCKQGGGGGLLSTTTTTLSTSGPEGALVVVGGIGIYLGGTALYDVLTNYFVDHPPTTIDPGVTGDNGKGTTITPGITGGIGPTITLPTGGAIIPTEPTTGTSSWNSGVSNGPQWTVGFSNGYIKNLGKAIRSPIVRDLCVGSSAALAFGLCAYQTFAASRQNINDAQNYGNPQDYAAIGGAWAWICYGLAAAGYSVAGSFGASY